jgi:hypothetical protein
MPELLPQTGVCGTTFTIDWIVKHLQEMCKTSNVALHSHESNQIGIGQGYMSTIVRVTLKWVDNKDGRLPSVVVLKVLF